MPKTETQPDPENLAIGRKVRIRMGTQRASQYDLARVLGISQPQVHQRLEGYVPWRHHELRAIAEYLDTTVDKLT